MLESLANRLGLKTNPTIFFVSAGLMILILIVFLVFPERVNDVFTDGREWVVTNLGWFFILGVSVWLVFLIGMAVSRFGKLRLGDDDDRPAFGNISWFTMLFAGGIGTVLMFWGVAEPMSHFSDPPRADVAPYSVEAAQDAMSFSLYHLGLHTWTIFALPGLAYGFFIYRYKLPMRVSSVFYPFIKDRIYGPVGKAIDIAAILGTLFGLAVSIGLGTQQVNAGLAHVTGDVIPDDVLPKVLIISFITLVALVSVITGLDKGVRRLSNINIGMAVGLMLFIFIAGSTVFLARQLIETIGLYAQNLVPLAFWNDAMASYTDPEGWGWQGSWTVFYWAWTVTWSPFMGIFLARISRGRTVREFILGVLVAPSAFTLVWFTVFGWSAMDLDGIGGEGGPIAEHLPDNVPIAMFEFFESFPAVGLIQGLAILIVCVFLITSSDTASLVVDMLCTGTGDAGPVRQRTFWVLAEGFLAATLIVVAGEAGLAALQEVITVIGLPIFIMVFAMIFAIIKAVTGEKELRHSLERSQARQAAASKRVETGPESGN